MEQETQAPIIPSEFTAIEVEAKELPPFPPSKEIQDDEVRIGTVQSLAELPEYETAEPLDVASCRKTPVLILSSRGYESEASFDHRKCRQFIFEYDRVNSIESYSKKVKQFMSATDCQQAAEAWIIHEMESTEDCQQPVIDGKIVPEWELLKPLKGSEPLKLGVFYLLSARPSPVETAPAETTDDHYKAAPENDKNPIDPPDQASLSNSEFHTFIFDQGVNWCDVRKAFETIESNEAMGKATAGDLASQISNCCRGIRSHRMSGIPRADSFIQIRSVQRQAAIECDKVFVVIVVGQYDNGMRRGFQEDKKNYKKIAQSLGCPREKVFTLCPSDGYVAASQIREFIANVILHCKGNAISPSCLFLGVAAHGSKAGIRTSDRKKIPIRELVLPLESLGGFVLLFYQACRGSRRHHATISTPAFEHQPGFACSLGFVSPDTAGCVLPPQAARSAAIFASMAGYEAYRNELDGSWMPRALLDAVRQPGRFSVSQLGQLVQAKLHELTDGMVRARQSGQSYTAYIQTQYSANEGCQNFLIQSEGLSATLTS